MEVPRYPVACTRPGSVRRAVRTTPCGESCPLRYDFFGPHAGAPYGRYGFLDRLQAYKVQPADDIPPHKFETGTKSLEDKNFVFMGGSSEVPFDQ